MDPQTPSRNYTYALAVVAIAFMLSLVGLSGVFSARNSSAEARTAARDARNATQSVELLIHQLSQASARAECARQINADLEEQWRHGIDGLLIANSRDEAHMIALALKKQPNAADEINRKCPAPIAQG